MAKYVDGFVIPISKKNVRKYKRMATLGCKIWMKYGALEYFECVGDDLKVKWGLTFPRMCKLKSNETAIFAYIVYRNKAHRNQVNKKVMSDPAMNMGDEKMPFDMRKFAMGGFKVLVEKHR